MNVWLTLAIIPILTIGISKLLSIYLNWTEKCKNKSIKQHKIHVLFPCHFALAIIAGLLCIYWFCTGHEYMHYGSLWTVIERGTLKALTSVMSIVGVGSILLGWIYSDRDKLTLGKSQIDLIHYCYGSGYAGSLVIHFGVSALAILMLECAAREAALWAFFTVAWGCIQQVWICLGIAMNRVRRERLALQLWNQEGTIRDKQMTIIQKMAEFLSEADIRYNADYREALASVIKSWLLDHYIQTSNSRGVTEGNIKAASVIFREILDKVPEQECANFEEEILKNVAKKLELDVDLDMERKNVAMLLLSCGYIRFLYAHAKEELGRRINRTVYFYQQNGTLFQNSINWIQDFLCGLEWFLFLNEQTDIPREATGKSQRTEYIENIFVQLVLSIRDNKESNDENVAKISWQQVYPGGEEE